MKNWYELLERLDALVAELRDLGVDVKVTVSLDISQLLEIHERIKE